MFAELFGLSVHVRDRKQALAFLYFLLIAYQVITFYYSGILGKIVIQGCVQSNHYIRKECLQSFRLGRRYLFFNNF